MPPPTLSYGLNLAPKKPQSATSTGAWTSKKRKKTIFDSDSESDNESIIDTANGEEITTLGGLTPAQSHQPATEPPSKKQQKAPSKPNPLTTSADKKGDKDYTNLAALHSSKKHAETAASIDPRIYDYDAIYDSLHSKKPTKSSSANADPDAPTVPKYMTNLLRSAEIRKRDQLRARDKLLAREREAEGDEFADKEKFVTAAYKAQQEEVRRIEAEEAAREREEEEKRKKGLGMTGFYKNMLARDGQRHEEAVKAAEEAVKNKAAKATTEEQDAEAAREREERSAAQVAAELNARGANIIINDEGEVVDKRQLLSAGLNVAAPKPGRKVAPAPSAADSRARDANRERFGAAASARNQQRARQTEMLAAQLEARVRKEKEEEEASLKQLAEKTQSKKTEIDVMSARERYLARKKEREKEKEQGNAK